MQNVHGCQETNEPEKLHYETQREYEQLHQNSCNTVFSTDMVRLRNIYVDTLHKGDTEDNNNNKEYN